MIPADRLAQHKALYGRSKATSIRPAVVPAWALKLIIVAAFVLWLTW